MPTRMHVVLQADGFTNTEKVTMTTDRISYFRINESHTCSRNNCHIFSHVYDRCWEFKCTVA